MASEKQSLREMMRQHREAKGKGKISDPLAKYSAAGQLFCVLCNTPVKSELVWTAHIQGRAHRQQIAALRSRRAGGQEAQEDASIGQKRKASVQDDSLARKQPRVAEERIAAPSRNIPANFFDNATKSRPQLVEMSSYSSESDEENDQALAASTSGTLALPADFFDSLSGSTAKATTTAATAPVQSMADKLPEGFFDDRKTDAKVRQVEYRNPEDEQYELFQQEIAKANQVSEQLVQIDDDEAQDERQFAELNEQFVLSQRVDTLRDRQQQHLREERQRRLLRQQQAEAKMDESGGDSDDDNDDDDLLDWRAKRHTSRTK